jgi:hypothetical protein
MVPAVVTCSEFSGSLSAEPVVATRAFLRGEFLRWLEGAVVCDERLWISVSSQSRVELLYP